MLPRLMDALDRCPLSLVALLPFSADDICFTGSGATCCAFEVESKSALCVYVCTTASWAVVQREPAHVMKPRLQWSSYVRDAQLAILKEEDNQS